MAHPGAEAHLAPLRGQGQGAGAHGGGGRRHARHGPRVTHGRAEAHRQRDGVAVRERSGRGRPRRGHPRGEHRLRGPAHHALLRGGISQANRGAGSGGEKR